MCPFVDKAPWCRGRLTLGNLFQAYVRCADHYESCPIYRKLLANGHHDGKPKSEGPLLATS